MKRSLSWFTALLLASSALPAAAAERYTSIKGVILNTKGEPAAQYRVVFRPEGEVHTFLSAPSGDDGRYTVALPEGATVTPVAVISPVGRRTLLEGQPSLEVVPGARRDIQLGAKPPPAPVPPKAVDEPPATSRPAAAIAGSTAILAATADSEPPPVPEGLARVGGAITGATGQLIEGARVIYRETASGEFFVSTASDAAGEYAIELPEEGSYTPIAVVARNGHRTDLELDVSLEPNPGARYDIKVASLGFEGPSAGYQTFPGSDRLFLSFVEDTALVNSQRVEALLDHSSFDSGDLTLSRLTAAFQLSALPQVELGASVGYGTADSPTGVAGGAGLTDLDLFAKVSFAGTRKEIAFGAILTVPTGDADAGLGQDAGGGKLFGALRRSLGFGLLAAHVGVEVRGDGNVGGVPLDGKVAPAASVALIYPATGSVTLIGELSATGELFDDTDPDVRLLGGSNWRIQEILTLRTAVSFGFTDGAPDWQVLAGISVDF